VAIVVVLPAAYAACRELEMGFLSNDEAWRLFREPAVVRCREALADLLDALYMGRALAEEVAKRLEGPK